MIGGLANMVLGTLAGAGYPGIAVMVGLESVGLPLARRFEQCALMP